MKLNQSFTVDGGTQYSIDDIDTSDFGVALFDMKSGIGGVDYMPADGDEVLMITGYAGLSPKGNLSFEPSMNDKAYYLVSNIEYTSADKDTIISLATEVPLSYAVVDFVGRYQGSFIFNNPYNHEYLYLIWDYSDNLDEGSISYAGNSTNRVVSANLTTDIGNAGINYVIPDTPVRIQIKWNGNIVTDTKYVGLNSISNYNDLIANGINPDDIGLVYPYDGFVNNGTGSSIFRKHISLQNADVIISAPLSSSVFFIEQRDTNMRRIYTDNTSGTRSNVCAQTPNVMIFHDGINVLPINGDRIYTDGSGSSIYNGDNAYHLISATSLGAPPASGGTWYLMSKDGYVLQHGSCDCDQYASPLIFQEDLFLTKNTAVDIEIQSTGTPTEFTVITDCDEYNLTGGTSGSIFTITTCDGVTKKVTVNRNLNADYQSTSTPVLIGGNGTFSLTGPSTYRSLPLGLAISNGRIQGTPQETCSYSLTLTATNCFGTGDPKTISISVETGIQLTPFLIDTENFGDTGDDACALSPIYTVLYHNGIGRVPDTGDHVFKDDKGAEPLMGGDRWYNIDPSSYSIKVNHVGKVCSKNECPSSTTTTTTTTSTTTTTTLPTGDWFNAEMCTNTDITAVLFDVTAGTITVGDIVKTTDGNCWEILSTTTGSYPYKSIENPVGTYTDCADCVGATTTTTTTTTTTAAPITSFTILNTPYPSSYEACAGGTPATTVYHNGAGAEPAIGDFVFTDAGGTITFDGGASWYKTSGGLSIQISRLTGQVLNSIGCSTTTTTTTTTIPTFYYSALECGSAGPAVKLSQLSFDELASGVVVKAANGTCYTIQSTTTGPAISNILFTYENCVDCQGVTTTTTTTTTTTSTTTTSTTTTTTTTAVPLIKVLVRFGTDTTVCSGTIIEQWIDGALGVSGNNIYKDAAGSITSDAGYYKLLNSSIAYEWDGDNWTEVDNVTCS
jgi:hypothetical protein